MAAVPRLDMAECHRRARAHAAAFLGLPDAPAPGSALKIDYDGSLDEEAIHRVSVYEEAAPGAPWRRRTYLVAVDRLTGDARFLHPDEFGPHLSATSHDDPALADHGGLPHARPLALPGLVEAMIKAEAGEARLAPGRTRTEAWMRPGGTWVRWKAVDEATGAAILAQARALGGGDVPASVLVPTLAGRIESVAVAIRPSADGDGLHLELALTPAERDHRDAEAARRAAEEEALQARLAAIPREDWDRPVDPAKLVELRQVLDAEAREAALATPAPDAPFDRFGSYLGGRPAWPRGRSWPTTLDGIPLFFVCQVDCAALPPLPDFPRQGLLQFFAFDDAYGQDWGEHGGIPRGHRVLWHASKDFEIDEEAINDPCAIAEDAQFPLTSPQEPVPLAFASMRMREFASQSAFGDRHPRFEHGFGAEIAALERESDVGAAHWLGGWPLDCQGNEPYDDDTVVLLRLASDDHVCWYDGGEGHFLVAREDLRAGRLDKAWLSVATT